MNIILKADIAGNPIAWIEEEHAISLVASGRAIAGLGETEFVYAGGWNRISGERSIVRVNSILLTRDRVKSHRHGLDYSPPLDNRALFARDSHQCLYCGEIFGKRQLTMDHVVPQAQGGPDAWENGATACKSCNSAKGNRTPEQWGIHLIAVPFRPNLAEYLYLRRSGRIIADQAAFLAARFPADSRLHQ